MCLGLEPRVAGWQVQTNPLSYGGTPLYSKLSATLGTNIFIIIHFYG